MTTDLFSADFWDDRYGSSDRIWSGEPNVQLVANTSSLTPGTALEVGAGEGADAVWLAQQGWTVRAVDVSRVGLAKASVAANAAGPQVAARLTWDVVDLATWTGDDRTYDLVTAHFMYLPEPAMSHLHQALFAAVAPGGTLLHVGHHPVDERPPGDGHQFPDLRRSAEDIAATLDPAEWASIETSTVAREGSDGHGGTRVIHDAVLVAVRR